MCFQCAGFRWITKHVLALPTLLYSVANRSARNSFYILRHFRSGLTLVLGAGTASQRPFRFHAGRAVYYMTILECVISAKRWLNSAWSTRSSTNRNMQLKVAKSPTWVANKSFLTFNFNVSAHCEKDCEFYSKSHNTWNFTMYAKRLEIYICTTVCGTDWNCDFFEPIHISYGILAQLSRLSSLGSRTGGFFICLAVSVKAMRTTLRSLLRTIYPATSRERPKPWSGLPIGLPAWQNNRKSMSVHPCPLYNGDTVSFRVLPFSHHLWWYWLFGFQLDGVETLIFPSIRLLAFQKRWMFLFDLPIPSYIFWRYSIPFFDDSKLVLWRNHVSGWNRLFTWQ